MAANIKNKAVVNLMGNDAESRRATTKAIAGLDWRISFTLDFEKLTLAVIDGIAWTKFVNMFINFVIAYRKMNRPVMKPQKFVSVKKKAVVKLMVKDAKSKMAIMKVLGELDGITSYTLDLEKSKLVVIGCTDPTKLVDKLRKLVKADLKTYGPEKDEGEPRQNQAVVKLVVNDAKSKKEVEKRLDGFTSYKLDFKRSTLVVEDCADPTNLVMKLRKVVRADLHKFF